jgi:hypothetical protein
MSWNTALLEMSRKEEDQNTGCRGMAGHPELPSLRMACSPEECLLEEDKEFGP